MTASRTTRLVALLCVLGCTAGCDQATKHIARVELSGMDSIRTASHFLELTLAQNPGGVLGLGAALPHLARSALTAGVGLVLALLLAYLVGMPGLRRLTFLGLSLISAGGLSNVIDRFLHHGMVTDFMVVRCGPFHTGVFNVADFAILAGSLMLIASLRAGARQGEAEGDAAGGR